MGFAANRLASAGHPQMLDGIKSALGQKQQLQQSTNSGGKNENIRVAGASKTAAQLRRTMLGR